MANVSREEDILENSFSILGGLILITSRNVHQQGKSVSFKQISFFDFDKNDVVLQQTEVCEDCDIYSDLFGLVHCHTVNAAGQSVLILQEFC